MSKATFDAVMAAGEAPYRSAIMHQTWGHLFPTGIYYEGYVRIANSIYNTGNGVPIDENIDISNSPWWFDAIQDFCFDVNNEMESGEVADFHIAVTVETVIDYPDYWDDMDEEERKEYPPDTFQRLNITAKEKSIIVQGYEIEASQNHPTIIDDKAAAVKAAAVKVKKKILENKS